MPAFAGLKFFWNHEFGKLDQAEAKDWVERYKGLRQQLSAGGSLPITDDYVNDRDAYLIRQVPSLGLNVEGAAHPIARREQDVPSFVERWMSPNHSWLARIRFEDASVLPWGNVGGGAILPWTIVFLAALLVIAAAWIWYASDWLFFARQDSRARGRPCDTKGLSPDDVRILLQISNEGFSNPRNRKAVLSLLERGYLTLAPDLRLACRGIESDLRAVERSNPRLVRECELPEALFGWRRARWVMAALMLAVSLFLLVAQPDLSSQVVGSITALTAAVASLRGAFDKISGWFSSKSGTA